MPISLRALSFRLLPGLCLLCAAPSHRQRDLCQACETELPWLGVHCRQCALPLPVGGDDPLCGQCLARPPAFSHCFCPLRYDFPVNRLVTGFKHHRQFPSGALLAELWLQHCREPVLAAGRPDLIVPVPLHWRRRLKRGYNQAQWLARQWATALEIPLVNAAGRQIATASQQGLSGPARRRNLRKAFRVLRPELVRGRHIALVDDVLTTGATAHSLADILARYGARRVDIWCVARTP